jgi:general secretion pathway protein A
MYLEHFGLREVPFSLAPDPRYLYLSAQHREALAHLLYGVRSEGGFVQLTGEVGTGKTTVCRCFLEQVPPETRAAVILNPRLTAEELLATVCDEFEIPKGRGVRATVKGALDRLNGFLLEQHAKGHRAVLVIDEAQNLDAGVLEQLRLLTNLETSRHKLLQIILMGQPELRATLARPELRQLAQRVTARFHLGPLSAEETREYVRHRLEVAGCQDPLFPPELLPLLRRLSGGIPRMINILCDRALLGAFVQGRRQVDRSTLRQAACEVAGVARAASFWRGRETALGVAGAVVTVAILGSLVLLRETGRPPAPTASPQAVRRSAASPPAAPAPLPASVAGGEGLLARPESLTEDAAFRALFALWGISYRAGENPCAQALAQGLACLRGEGGAEQARRFDRPAVLALTDTAGGARFVTLSGIREGRWSIATGGGTTVVEARWFASFSPGGFTLLWRMPLESRGVIAPGERGPALAWLERRLERALGQARQPRPDPVYDAVTAEAVRRFQRGAGLPEDGIAGPQTLLLLDAEPGPGTPTLTGALRGEG